MLGRAVAGLLVLGLASCSESVAPTGILSGRWYAGSGLPSGAYTMLSLRHTDATVTGTVADYWGPENRVADQGTVTGTYSDSAFDLRLQYEAAGLIHFTGFLVGSDTLRGTETPVHSASSTFLRQSW